MEFKKSIRQREVQREFGNVPYFQYVKVICIYSNEKLDFDKI